MGRFLRQMGKRTGMKIIGATFLVLSCLISSAYAGFLDDLKAKQTGISTVHARFIQEKQTKLLVNPIKSSGSFFFKKPDRIRWEYTGSINMQVMYDGKELWLYYPELSEADKISGLPQYSTLLNFDITTLSSDYDITGKKQNDTLQLRLTPKTKGPVTMIVMEFRGQSPFPDTVQLEDSNGELTKISFKDVKLNSELSNETFRFKPGDNIRVRERTVK